MSARLLWCPIFLSLMACTIGTQLDNYPLANSPAGIEIRVVVEPSRRYVGELLGVSDSALVLRWGEQLYELPYRRIRTATFTTTSVRLGRGRAPSPAVRAGLAQRSRYPQGITQALLRELLAAYGQDRLLQPAGT